MSRHTIIISNAICLVLVSTRITLILLPFQTPNRYRYCYDVSMSMAQLFFNLRFLSKAAILFAVMFLIVDIAILGIVMKPQMPSFHLNSVTVTSLNTTTKGGLTATFDVAVSVTNPNSDLSVSYKSLEVTTWFGYQTIASASVAPFWQKKNQNEIMVRARFGAVSKVFPRGVINGIVEQRARGSVDFGLTLVARVRFWWCGFFRTRVRHLKVECYPLHIVFSPNDNINNNDTGRLVGPSECYRV